MLTDQRHRVSPTGIVTLLPDAELCFFPEFLAASETGALFRELRNGLSWTRHRVHMFGREITAPRLSCWIGDKSCSYRYSGQLHTPQPWPEVLRVLRVRIEEVTAKRFNSVLANLYRDGADSIAWHADNEPELGPAPTIASLSLGGARRFCLRHRHDLTRHAEWWLTDGSLLCMAGRTQACYCHAVPKTRKPVRPRINLTFRWIFPPSQEIPTFHISTDQQ